MTHVRRYSLKEKLLYLQLLEYEQNYLILEILDQSEIYDKMFNNMKFYRQPDGGVYKNKVWSRREYK